MIAEVFVNEDNRLAGFDKNKWLKGQKELIGKNCILSLNEKPNKRSLNANAYYWGHVLEVIRENCGYKINEKQQLHEHFKSEYIEPEIKIEIDPKTREKIKIFQKGSTRNMSVKRFSQFIEDVMQEGAELGCIFQDSQSWCAEHSDEINKYMDEK